MNKHLSSTRRKTFPHPKNPKRKTNKQTEIKTERKDFQAPSHLILKEIILSEKLISFEKYSIHLALSTSPL